MATTSAAVSAQKSNAGRAILWGGLIAGACDITYAIVSNMQRGGAWDRTLQSVASGWMGRAAFQGGMPTAALGLASHFLIAFIWTTIYYAASRWYKPLARNPWLYGGIATVALGLASNLLIAFIWGALFFVASSIVKPLWRNPWLSGPLYGALVYVLMNNVVVPLSAAPFKIPLVTTGLLVHMFLVGLPIAIAASRSSRG